MSEKDPELSPQQRQQTSETYAGQAVNFLRQAVAKGCKDGAEIGTIEEFASLRSWPDFQALVKTAAAAAKSPNRANPSANEQIQE